MTERQLLLPCARIVQGHPMEGHQKKDNNGILKLMSDGSPLMNFYIAVAIAKGAEQHWNQTEWGAVIYQSGVENWPNGEHGSPVFAWKVIDGDSQIPDRQGTAPAQKEGFAGHWIVRVASCFSYPCYHTGHLQPHETIQNPKEIKCGDYVRVEVSLSSNTSTQSPGLYVNPLQLEVVRAGIQIVSKSMPDAAGTFGSIAAVLPTNAQIDTAVAPVAPIVQPVAPIVQPVAPIVQPVAPIVQPVAPIPNVAQIVPDVPVVAPVIAPVAIAPAALSAVVPATNYPPQ